MIILIRFIAGVVTAGIISLFGFTSNVNAATLLFSDGFENGTGKWTYFNDQIVSAPAPVHGGTKSLYYDGWPGTAISFQPTPEVYLSYWWYLPVGFDGVFKSGRHYFQLGVQNEHHRALDTYAGGSDNSFHIHQGNFYHVPNAAILPEGRWFKIEFYNRLNDPGVANGEMGLWLDGVEKHRKRNLILTNNRNKYNEFLLTVNYASCADAPTCNWWMDDVEVWNGCPPGSPCGSWSTTEPPTEEPPTEEPL